MSEIDTLSADERAELEALRAEKLNPPVENKPVDEPESELPETHWLNLADGTTIKSKGVATHVDGIPVLHATLIPPELLEGGDPSAPAPHRF